MSKRGLGKGLDALLSTSSLAREKQQSALHSQELSSDGNLTDLNINCLKPGIYQPRKEMEPEALEELAASIESQGIIQPIVVRQVENDKFEIIAGERRWRAARKAGLASAMCGEKCRRSCSDRYGIDRKYSARRSECYRRSDRFGSFARRI